MEYKNLKFQIKKLDEKGIFEGYAAVKGNVDSYGDIIEDGAFEKTIAENKSLPILFMHDPAKPCGLSTYLREDKHGLFTRGQLDLDTELGRTVYSGLKKKYIDSMSIGYTVEKDDMNEKGNRLLKEVKLLEYSLITKGFAANDLALVSGFKSRKQIGGDKMENFYGPGLEEDMKRMKRRHEKLRDDHEELRDEHEELKREHRKMKDMVKECMRRLSLHHHDEDDDYKSIEDIFETKDRGSLFF